MGFFSRLFGKDRSAPAPSPLPAEIQAALAQPPRLVSEGPEFPREVVLRRGVTVPQVEVALAKAGFTRPQGEAWSRGGTIVECRAANDVLVLAFSGTAVVDAQREVFASLAWVDPLAGFYEQMRSPKTPLAELRHLVRALRHYQCVGGVPMELRTHSDPEIQETVRLIDRDVMARAARAQRSKRNR